MVLQTTYLLKGRQGLAGPATQFKGTNIVEMNKLDLKTQCLKHVASERRKKRKRKEGKC